jgi:chromosome segregation ATPase
LFISAASATKVQGNPVAKVLELLEGMRSKIVEEGESEQKTYEEYAHWCRTESKEMAREVTDAKEVVAELRATIEKATADIGDLTAQIDELASATSTAETELKEAEQIRKKEHADYSAVAADLSTAVDELERAVTVIEREAMGSGSVPAAAGPAVETVLTSLSALVAASTVDTSDVKKLKAFLQAGDSESEAPAAAAYESHGGTQAILDTLNKMLERAEAQKADADKAEMQAKHDFVGLKASLEGAIATQKKEREAAKKEKASNEQTKANAEGDLEGAEKQLAGDLKVLNDAHADCEERAHEWDASMQSRHHEIEALDMASKILQEKTGGAQSQAYSFLQLESSSRSRGSNMDSVVKELVNVGKSFKDRAIAMLAMRVRSAATSSADPFAKVKGLIENMITKLEEEAAEEASAKAFCDQETKKTKAKKDDHTSTITDLTAKIDSAHARIAKLKEQISTLSEELKSIAAEQAEATAIRQEQKAEYETVAKDYQDGIDGVQMALKVLRDYYGQSFAQESQPAAPAGHSKSSGGGSSIIGILEVAESDFGKLLAEASESEQAAESEFDEMTEDNKIATAEKKTDVKYKSEEVTNIEHDLSEMSNDRDGEQEELDSVLEYLSKLNDKCVAKPEPYEERKRRREQEMDGLKTALDILEGQALAFVSVKRHLRRVA